MVGDGKLVNINAKPGEGYPGGNALGHLLQASTGSRLSIHRNNTNHTLQYLAIHDVLSQYKLSNYINYN